MAWATVDLAQPPATAIISNWVEARYGRYGSPREGLEQRQGLGRDDAVGAALLDPAAQAACPVHNPDLGVPSSARGRPSPNIFSRAPQPLDGPGLARAGLGGLPHQGALRASMASEMASASASGICASA